MKLGKRQKVVGVSPSGKAAGSYLKILIFVCIFVGLIAWVGYLASEASSTIQVAMLNTNVYKNQAVTVETCVPYAMLKAEYEKLTLVNEDGTTERRIITWDEWTKGNFKGLFAAYPLMEGDYAQFRSFVNARTSNKNTVLYSYPGKEVVSFDIDGDILKNYKSFLSPGDKINIYAIYSESKDQETDDGYGGKVTEKIETFKSELAFNNIMIADVLNSSGDSVLDMYTYYNTLTVWQQQNLDNDANWQTSTEPKALLVALTPEELDRYYFYKTRKATYECALPQRTAGTK